jgi:hypothetical protein
VLPLEERQIKNGLVKESLASYGVTVSPGDPFRNATKIRQLAWVATSPKWLVKPAPTGFDAGPAAQDRMKNPCFRDEVP